MESIVMQPRRTAGTTRNNGGALAALAEHLPDPELAKFYKGLMASEARHYGMYWTLAHHYCNQDEIIPRLEELAEVESDVLSRLHPEPRVHS